MGLNGRGAASIIITDNVGHRGRGGSFKSDRVREGVASLTRYAPGGWTVRNNAIIGGQPGLDPGGNYFPGSEVGVPRTAGVDSFELDERLMGVREGVSADDPDVSPWRRP